VSAEVPMEGRQEPDGPIRRIVVATDFTDASNGAIRTASVIARAFDADLVILHVFPDPGESSLPGPALGMTPGDVLERRAGEAQGRLRRIQALVGPGHSHATIRCGSAAVEILRFAKESGADLIVVGTHGVGASREACGEVVAARVRVQARCPVIVVSPSQSDATSASPSSPAPIHGILVASDLTESAEAAIAYGCSLGQRLGCPVHVVHVTRHPRSRPRRTAGQTSEANEQAVRAATVRLEATLAACTRRTGNTPVQGLIRVGDPATKILACARALGDDLVIVGGRRGRSLRRAVLGSVARQVVADAACATMTVRTGPRQLLTPGRAPDAGVKRVTVGAPRQNLPIENGSGGRILGAARLAGEGVEALLRRDERPGELPVAR
jgi:nucleotide-binding universal stress UspA family protein